MKITFVIGGARSGKSSFALNQASKIEGPRVYIATAEALDEEMKARIEKHRVERGSGWDTHEEPLNLSDALMKTKDKYKVAVVDCLTIWLSNLMMRTQNIEPRSRAREETMQDFTDMLLKLKHSSVCSPGSGLCVLYIVTNEVGMGIVPENSLARLFRDLAGDLNQEVAAVADEVFLVTAGIPLKLKDQR